MTAIVPRCLLLCVAIGLACCGAAASEKTDAPRPNILLILADNLGYGDLGCYGCPDIRTPVIDRLASEGVRFTGYYAGGPECTPSRTALMTGRYPQRVGGLECAIGSGHVGRYDDAIRLRAENRLGLPPAENTLVHSLKRAGYSVVGLGKWHLGYDKKFLPPAHGFDYFLGTLGGTVDYFYHTEPNGNPALFENDRLVRRDATSPPRRLTHTTRPGGEPTASLDSGGGSDPITPAFAPALLAAAAAAAQADTDPIATAAPLDLLALPEIVPLAI